MSLRGLLTACICVGIQILHFHIACAVGSVFIIGADILIDIANPPNPIPFYSLVFTVKPSNFDSFFGWCETKQLAYPKSRLQCFLFLEVLTLQHGQWWDQVEWS